MRFEDIADLDLMPETLTRPVPTHYRIGLIGLGRFVNNSALPAYRSHRLQVVAAADPDPAARERAAKNWGIPNVYDDYRQMLDSERLDVVDINLRWDRGMSESRIEAVAAAASRGIHVLIAKPLAETLQQCETIVKQAGRGGIKLAVNQNSRFGPTAFAIHRMIDKGVIGPLVSAAIYWNAARGPQHKPEFDAVHDVTVHQVDVLLSWFGMEPVQVFASHTRRTPAGSVLVATLVFGNGANATIRDDFATEHRRSWDFAAVGEAGSVDGTEDIEVPEPGQPRMLRSTVRVGFHSAPGVAVELPLKYRYAPDSFYSTMASLLQAIDAGTEPWASGTNVLKTMRTLDAIERSVRDGVLVQVTGAVAARP